MKTVFKIEFIGENIVKQVQGMSKFFNDICEISGKKLPKEKINYGIPWVAKIIGFHPKFKYKREFQDYQKDYSEANSVCSRGVYLYFHLDDGIYETSYKASWGRSVRYFFKVENGEIIDIKEEEVLNILKEAVLKENEEYLSA